MGTPAAPPPSRFNFAAHLLARNAGRTAKTAYIDDQQALSYGELAQRVGRMAAALAGLGLRREERVLVCLHDTVDFPVVFLGTLHAGVIPVAANTLLTADDYAYMLEHSRARAIFVSGTLLPAHATGDGARCARRPAQVIVSRPSDALPAGCARSGGIARNAVGDGSGAGDDRRRRHCVLALFFRIDRAAEGHRAYARQSVLDRRDIRPVGARRCATTTSCFPRRSFSSHTAWAMR